MNGWNTEEHTSFIIILQGLQMGSTKTSETRLLVGWVSGM